MIKLLKLILLTSFLSTAWAAEDNSIIIDVRTTDEWQAGHLQSAKHLPLDRVEAEITELVADKNTKVYLYCRSGNRSGKAKAILDSLGYSTAINAGGITQASQLLNQEIVQ
jgi:phage shock protein E